MLRKLRKHSKPIITVTILFFLSTIIVSLLVSVAGLFVQ